MPNNTVLFTNIYEASTAIYAKCIVSMSHEDPSSPITTGTIVTFSDYRIFDFYLQVLVFGYFGGCCDYHIIVLWECDVNQL